MATSLTEEISSVPDSISLRPGTVLAKHRFGVQPHSATTYARGVTRVLVLSGSSLFGLYESNIHLYTFLIMNIAREASRRQHATDEMFPRYQ